MTDRTSPDLPLSSCCPQDGRILGHYAGRFESVYILLSPFIRPVTIDAERFCPERYPGKQEILEGCEGVSWARVLELTPLESLSNIDIALRTLIGGLAGEKARQDWGDFLDNLAEDKGIIAPAEGELSPLLENRFFKALQTLGHETLWVRNEFGEGEECWPIEALIEGDQVPVAGCLYSEERDILLTSHWDSHCSFLCASRATIEKILDIDPFEGFFCTEKAQVYWGLYETEYPEK